MTGSGKTEVYLRLAEDALAAGRSVLVLVPEIGLTPQLVGRFAARFAGTSLAVMHSGLTDGARLSAWRRAQSGEARLVIGTRSAIFAPVPALGLILVDEEHDASFKQQEGGFRYSARDLALARAHGLGIPVVLGSATPSLETLHNAATGRMTRLCLPERTADARPPRLRLIDLREERVHAGLATTSVTAIERHLAAEGQVLVYINRRGYAPTLAFLDAARRAAGRPPQGLRLLGPAPAALARRADRHHAQLLLDATERTLLHRFLDGWLPQVEALPEARRVRWALDVDPLELF